MRVRSYPLQSGDNGEEVPPVPIPNTVVKLFCVEDTWWATARENRSSPEQTAGFLPAVFLFFLLIIVFMKVIWYTLTVVIFAVFNNVMERKL